MAEVAMRRISVCELEEFTRQAAKLWSADDLDLFIDFVSLNPKAGDLIEGTGGVRKIRWGRQNTGKRGGVRVIYFYYSAEAPLFLLSIFAKSTQADISPTAKAALRHFTSAVKTEFGRARKGKLQ